MRCSQCGEHAAGAFCDEHRGIDDVIDPGWCDPYAETADLVTEIEPQDLMWSAEP